MRTPRSIKNDKTVTSEPALDLDRPELRPLVERYISKEGGMRTWPLLGVPSSAILGEAATMMSDRGVSVVAVFDEQHHLLGIITERDLTWTVAQGKDTSNLPVTDVLNDFPVILDAPVTQAEVLEAMRRSHIRHVIIKEDVDEYRIVSMRDLVFVAEPPMEAPATAEAHLQTPPPRPPEALTATPVRRFMTAPVAVCYENDDLETVATLLTDREVSGLPVLSAAGRVVGVVSETDVARALGAPLLRIALRPRHSGPFLREAPSPAPRTAAEIMSSPPLVAHPDTPLHTIAEIMVKKAVNRLPVVDNDRLVGVVSRGDVLKALSLLDG